MPDKRRVKRANYYRYVVITLTHEASHRCGSLRNLEAREQELASEGVGLGVALLQRRHDHAHRRAYLLVRSMERVSMAGARGEYHQGQQAISMAASVVEGVQRDGQGRAIREKKQVAQELAVRILLIAVPPRVGSLYQLLAVQADTWPNLWTPVFYLCW